METGAVTSLNPFRGQTMRRFWNLKTSPTYYAACTEDGQTVVVDPRTHSLVTKLKMSSDARDLCFDPTGSNALWTADCQGEVYEWDLRRVGGGGINAGMGGINGVNGGSACVNRWKNDGALDITVLASAPVVNNGVVNSVGTNNASRNGSMSSRTSPIYLACGTSSGTVDLFSTLSTTPPQKATSTNSTSSKQEQQPTSPQLTKTFDQLHTNMSSIAFHESGEIMAFASKFERDALRVAHVKSKTVFSNWPGAKTPLRYIHSLAFSKNMLAVGNDKGKVLLYNLEHYC